MNSFRFRLAGLAMATSAMAFSVPALADGYLSGPRAAGCCFSWTGFYIGVNAGGAWADFGNSLAGTNATPAYFNPLVISAVNAAGSPDLRSRGFPRGGAFCFYSLSGEIVSGIYVDFSSLHLKEN